MFLEDRNIPIDNSATDRAIHPFTIGRANGILTPSTVPKQVQLSTALLKLPRPMV